MLNTGTYLLVSCGMLTFACTLGRKKQSSPGSDCPFVLVGKKIRTHCPTRLVSLDHVNPSSSATDGAREKGSNAGKSPEMVEESGELCTISLCRNFSAQRREERNEPAVNQRQWRRLVGEQRSRGKLAVGVGFLGVEHKIMDIYADKKMYRTRTVCWKKPRRH